MKKLNWKCLIAMPNGNVSLGRVSYWLSFIALFALWMLQWEVPSSAEIVFLTLCSYNLGTKVNDTIKAHLNNKQKKIEENIE